MCGVSYCCGVRGVAQEAYSESSMTGIVKCSCAFVLNTSACAFQAVAFTARTSQRHPACTLPLPRPANRERTCLSLVAMGGDPRTDPVARVLCRGEGIILTDEYSSLLARSFLARSFSSRGGLGGERACLRSLCVLLPDRLPASSSWWWHKPQSIVRLHELTLSVTVNLFTAQHRERNCCPRLFRH